MMKNLLPAAKSLGLDTTGLPNDAEMKDASEFISGMDARLLVVGEEEIPTGVSPANGPVSPFTVTLRAGRTLSGRRRGSLR
jgi:hypothetical protein